MSKITTDPTFMQRIGFRIVGVSSDTKRNLPALRALSLVLERSALDAILLEPSFTKKEDLKHYLR